MRLTAAPVVPDEVTTLKTSSSGMLRSVWLLKSPMGSIGTSGTDSIRSGSCSSAVRTRRYSGHRSRCHSVSSRRRAASTRRLLACRSEYCGTRSSSSTCIALGQGLVVDLAGWLQRQRVDVPHGERPRVQAEAPRDLPGQVVTADL